MNSIYEFFGRMLTTFYSSTGSLVFSVAVFAAILKLLFMFVSNKYYRSPKMAEMLQPKIDKINKKYDKNPDKRGQAISELLLKNQYVTFGFIFYYILEMFIATMISLTMRTPALYITGAADAAVSFLFIPDMTIFTFNGIRSLWPDISALRYMALPAAAVLLQYFHDTYMSDRSLVERRWFDYIALGITLVASIALPQMFCVYWIVYMLISLVQILVNNKFIDVKLTEIKLPDENGKKTEKSGKK